MLLRRHDDAVGKKQGLPGIKSNFESRRRKALHASSKGLYFLLIYFSVNFFWENCCAVNRLVFFQHFPFLGDFKRLQHCRISWREGKSQEAFMWV